MHVLIIKVDAMLINILKAFMMSDVFFVALKTHQECLSNVHESVVFLGGGDVEEMICFEVWLGYGHTGATRTGSGWNCSVLVLYFPLGYRNPPLSLLQNPANTL